MKTYCSFYCNEIEAKTDHERERERTLLDGVVFKHC